MRNAGWIFFTFFCLIFFTLTKLPDDRIKGFIQGNISSALAGRGISLTANESKISFLFGPSYVMRDVTLNFPPPEAPAHIDKIEISPSIFPLLLGKLAAKVSIKNGDGEMSFTGGMRGSHVFGSLTADQFDLGKIGLLKLAADISGSALVTGKGDFSTSLDDMTETEANIQLDLQKIVINSQSIQGFTIPRLSMSQGRVEIEVNQGKGQVKTLKIGRPDSPSDDIKASITGDFMLGKTLQNATCNLKAVFSFSPSLLKSFVLLDAILAAGKQADGSYVYRLNGPLLSPNPIPGGS
jgi:type II secretion system protein N